MDDDVPCMTSDEARETFDLGASSPVIAARASWTPQTREWDCARACEVRRAVRGGVFLVAGSNALGRPPHIVFLSLSAM